MNFRKVILLSLLAVPALSGNAGAALLQQRHSHTTTLLADGNILVAGGVTDSGDTVTNSVQMYNMATNQYENWGNLAVARSSHTATLMSDGRVLIAGGFDGSGHPLSSLEICDPKAKNCAAAGVTMSTPRGGHTATLLSRGLGKAGQVLICGGQNGNADISVTGSCDLFNPSATPSPTITPAGALVSPRMGHAAVLLYSGKVFVTGGRSWNGSNWVYLPNNEIYDPNLDKWTPVSVLLQGRINHTATVLNNGLIMVAGGYNDTNSYMCGTLGQEDCWVSDDLKYWGYPITSQDMGSHGYLDGAELYDQNGAATVIGEAKYGVTPYRVKDQSAALLPDGSWNMFGGYGGIVRTVFTDAPVLTSTSVFHLNPTGDSTADILPDSVVEFPIKAQLARPVSGRLVNADAFYSIQLPVSGSIPPSVSIDTAKFYMGNSTAALDGLYVGYKAPGDQPYDIPGKLDNTTRLTRPAGTATFPTASGTSDSAKYPNFIVTNSTIIFVSPYYPTDSAKAFNGTVTATIGLTLPSSYRGITGKITIAGGSLTNAAKTYTLTFDPNTTPVAFGHVDYPTDCSMLTTCVFVTTVTFTDTGLITNLTTDTTLYANVDARGNPLTLTLNVIYTADHVYALARAPAFAYGRSDIVVREMIFSSELGYYPGSDSWKDLTDPLQSPVLAEPVFDHTTLVTPAADTAVIGGRNCEANPAADCLRGNKTFTARPSRTVFIPVFKAADGSVNWPKAGDLLSRRAYHTSTLLMDGSILTCGGSDGTNMLATCELMNPETKTWSATGSMNYPRTRHTATLLPNGNVLVAGGATPSSSAVNTAEIFYPATQRWVSTAQMSQPRQNHTATLLPDGNVLVAGGATLSTFSATAEIYISSISAWQSVGDMTAPRAQHTATLLKNGNVLMAGGANGFGATNTTDIYNFAARTFTAGNPMSVGRYGHTANLLRDGRVLVIGGSNNSVSQITSEIYDPSSGNWASYMDPVGQSDLILNLERTNHRSVLLPDGKVMVTGGLTAGMAQQRAESYDPDFSSWSDQGKLQSGRANHTTILTMDNYVINIGGWDGSKYLNSTDIAYYSYFPDMEGLSAATTRQATISTVTPYFDRTQNVTLNSADANFHGITEANGGGAGAQNSSASNPRVYMTQIDNPSGFMIDLSTRIYSWYGGNNAWDAAMSSITIASPANPGELPYGWYNMRVAANGLFSKGRTVQVTIPRPVGAPSTPSGNVLGTDSVNWSWNSGSITGTPDGYNIYASSNNVFIGTTAFNTSVLFYTQAGLAPNTAASIAVNAYNTGGVGALSQSATYYTLAAPPTALTINSASFETASLSWNSANSAGTKFELSMCAGSDFVDPLAITTPIPFDKGYTSTSAVLTQLSADTVYYFRVRAINGDGITTAYSNRPSTITVAAVNNFIGTAVSSSAISWAWGASGDPAAFYELYDVTAGTAAAVYLGSTTYTSYVQQGLSANNPYAVAIRAGQSQPTGNIYGPFSIYGPLATLAMAPTAPGGNTFVQVTTGSFTANWMTNGNSTWTVYNVSISTNSAFPAVSTSSGTTLSSSFSFSKLLPNTKYYVSVTAINSSGVATAAASLGYKYTLARPPASVTPAETSISGVVLTWNANSNPDGTVYEVRLTTDSLTGGAITTPAGLRFSDLYTYNYATITGLLTSTTYYMDVAACNGEGLTLGCTGTGVTSRIQAVPAAYTAAGPGGAPGGSVGGTALPNQNTVISGTLLNNRAVTLTVPEKTFPASTDLAISISTDPITGCTPYPIMCGVPVKEAIYSANATPLQPVTFTTEYRVPGCTSLPGTAITDKLVLARYNPLTQQCLPLETYVDIGSQKITATLNTFGIFTLIMKSPAADLSGVLVYPNPFYTNRGNGYVTINNMPASAKVRIYTLSGDKVWEGTASTTGMIIWKAVNKQGQLVASGVYLAVIDSSAGKKVVKLAVER